MTDANRGYVKGQPTRFCKGHRSSMVDAPEAFWKRVDRRGADECWEWQRYRKGGGFPYGVTRAKGNRTFFAHRIAYLLAYGPIPAGLIVCHQCDNPPCCNPAHLFLGTDADNIRDMYSKGRQPRDNGAKGEANHGAKLSEGQVREIRERYGRGGIFQRQLADEFGLTLHATNAIIRRRTWRHVE